MLAVQYVGSLAATLGAAWFLLAAFRPTTAMQRATINLSRGERTGAAAAGVVLLLCAAVGVFAR